MSITIDDRLVDEARKALGARTRAEAIRIALREAVRQQRLAQALEHRGRVDIGLDRKTLSREREEQ